MKKTLTITIFLFVLLALGIFSANSLMSVSPNASFDYKWTKAICEDNVCRDYLITCKSGEVLEINPITGFVTFSDNWEDPRDEELRERLC